MFGTEADAFAIDHHGTGERQAPHACSSHGGKHDRRAPIVGGGIVRQVVCIDAESHLGREVENGIHSFYGPVDGVWIPHVPK